MAMLLPVYRPTSCGGRHDRTASLIEKPAIDNKEEDVKDSKRSGALSAERERCSEGANGIRTDAWKAARGYRPPPPRCLAVAEFRTRPDFPSRD